MSIIAQLEYKLDFSQSEKILSQYILENGEDILKMNAKDLAKYTYTSPATVVRLCQKLGLKGYSEFKIKYSAELMSDSNGSQRINVNFPFKKDDDYRTICNNILRMSMEVIDDTIELLNFDDIHKIVDLLYKSKRIYLYGSGNSVIVALDFEHKMCHIGRDVSIKIIEGEQVFTSYKLTENDSAIIISYTGETQYLIDIAKILKNHKTPIVLITAVGTSRLSVFADYIINTCSREKIYNKIAPFASIRSIQYILDLLFCAIFQKDYDKNVDFKVSQDKQYEQRTPNSPIAQE